LQSNDTGTKPRIEQRYRLLIEAITDYAIYMLDPAATSRVGTRERSG